jgi:ATP-dependent RNA helicase HelY
VVTAERQACRLSVADFPTPVVALTRLKVPRNFSSRNPQMRRDLASALRSRTHDLAPPPPSDRRSGSPRVHDEVDRLRSALRAHPCHDCPDREDHARWAERWFRLDKDARTLRRRVEERTNTVARQFDRVCEVLAELDYLSGDTVTERGRRLMRLYSDLDLVTAEALRKGVLDGLATSGVAAALSVLVFEARRPDDEAPRVPGGVTGAAIEELGRLAGRLQTLEKQHRLDFTRLPDAGFAWATYRWAEGDELDDVLGASGLAAGDFVRWMKQVIDLAGQVADAAGDTPVRKQARAVVKALRRGVVAYSAV